MVACWGGGATLVLVTCEAAASSARLGCRVEREGSRCQSPEGQQVGAEGICVLVAGEPAGRGGVVVAPGVVAEHKCNIIVYTPLLYDMWVQVVFRLECQVVHIQ